MSEKSNLVLGREYVAMQDIHPLLGRILQRFGTAINNLSINAGISPLGETAPPPNIGGLNVKPSANGEQVHVTINDANPIDKPVEWFLEHSVNDENFTNPHVIHLVSSRGTVLNLPTFQDDAETKNKYYFRAYSQYPGSQPSKPVYYGGSSPIGVTLNGETAMTLLPSTGSGTGSSTGNQGGWGRGKVLSRPAPGAKRNVG